jgi:thiol:disulfide interchange protein DsbD
MVGFTDLLNQWNYQLGKMFDELATGSLLAVLIVFAAGVVTSFTPCVYPVIPVTVTYLGGAAGGNKRRAVTLSLTYVAGLAVVYTSLGVAAALLGKTFGLYTRSPWIFGGVGLLIVFLGLGMLDIYAIRVPAFLSGVQTKGAQKGGYLGALLMGVASAFVTAPCAAPVLGSLLAVVGRSQKVVWGSFLLLVFALGLSLLLLVLGIFSGLVSTMPKPGRWMDWIKKAFGIAMIAVGVWFVYQAVMMVVHRGALG